MNPQLIKTIDEVVKQVPVNMTSDFDRIAPFLRTAEVSYVQRLIGKDQFDALVTLYDDDALTDEQAEAVSLCQKVIANLGYYFGSSIISLSIGASGIQITSNSDTKNAFQWQVNDMKDALQGLGFTGIEELLNYLESLPLVFTQYAASDQLQAQKVCLITTAADFSDYFDINGSRFVFQSIAYLMKRVEQQEIVKLVGAAFLQGLKADGLTGKQTILVNTYLKPGIALLTIAKAIVERVISMQNGVVSYNFKGRAENMMETQAANNQQVSDMSFQLITDGNVYLQDGLQYIIDNPTDFIDFTPPMARRRFRVTNNPDKGAWAN